MAVPRNRAVGLRMAVVVPEAGGPGRHLQESMRPHSHPHLFEVLVDLMGAFHHRSREDHADVVIGEATKRPSIVADDGEIRQDLCRIAQRCG